MNPTYKQQGFLVLQDRVCDERCIKLCTQLEIWKKDAQKNRYGILHHNIHLVIEEFALLLEEVPLQKYAENIYGGPLIFFQDNLIWKPPHTEQEISWHQDYSYWPLSSPKGITLWLALDDINEYNGGIEYCAQSHKQGECIPNDFVHNKPAAWARTLPSLNLSPSHSILPSLTRGSILVHHPLCAHRSGKNKSNSHRRGWSISFVDPTLLWNSEHAPHPYTYSYSCKTGDSVCTLPLEATKKSFHRYPSDINNG